MLSNRCGTLFQSKTFRILTLSVLVCSFCLSVNGDEDKKIKVAVLTNAGGAHLGAYFPALSLSDVVESVVLGDPDGQHETMARNALKSKFKKTYTNYDDLLEIEKPEMVLISVEAKLAPEIISKALDAGCHVMAEKPACLNAGDFEKLVIKAKEKKKHLMLAFANRLNPEIQEAKRIISEGLLGKLYGMELQLVKDQTRLTSPSYQKLWYADKNRAGGGHLTWLGIHWVDLAMYLTDSKITDVTGFAGNVGGQPINTEDSAALVMKFDNGIFATMTSGYYLDRGLHSSISIWGSDGWLKISSNAPRNVQWYSRKVKDQNGIQTFKGNNHVAYNVFVDAAARASAGLQEAPLTGEECLSVLKTVYGLYESSQTGKVVHVK